MCVVRMWRQPGTEDADFYMRVTCRLPTLCQRAHVPHACSTRLVSCPARLPCRQVFCASDSRAHEEMRQACFDYLALGGIYSCECRGAQGKRCCSAGLEAATGRCQIGVHREARLPAHAAAPCARQRQERPPACTLPPSLLQHCPACSLSSIPGPSTFSPFRPAAGPVSLLSGLNPRPSVLVTHFFMVALFGVGRCAGHILLLKNIRWPVRWAHSGDTLRGRIATVGQPTWLGLGFRADQRGSAGGGGVDAPFGTICGVASSART